MEAGGRRFVAYPSRSDWFTVYNISDIHYGNKGCAVDRLKEDVERIRQDDHSFWFGGGDYAEYISYSDRRFDASTITEELGIADLGRLGSVLTRRVSELLRPIAHKCFGLLYGNHERVYQREKDQQNLHAWLCQDLGVPNLGYCALTDVIFARVGFGRQRARLVPQPKNITGQRAGFRFFLHHGAGFANTPGGKLNKLIQFMERFDADIYMVGHCHDQKAQRLPRIGANERCEKIVATERIGIMSGAYLKTYAQGITTYGEVKGYAPTPLGASFVRIRPETREVRAEV